MEKFFQELPRKTFIQRTNLIIVSCLLASSTALVSFNLHAWVPILLVFAGAFEYTTAYMQLETSIPNLNASATELTNVQMWWNGLTLIQSRQPSNRDALVDRCENAILSQYAQHAGATLLFAKQRYSSTSASADQSAGGVHSDDNKKVEMVSSSK